jgi:TatA/E family protein of Tat protein translocase
MFENLSVPHVLMVIAIALLLFGPKRIPEIAGSFGKGIREFKKSINDIQSDDASERSRHDQTTDARSQPSEVERDRAAPKRLL